MPADSQAVRRLLDLIFSPGTRFARYGPAIAWTLLIAVVNSIPGDRYPEVRFPLADKWVHFALYLPLGLLYARAGAEGEKAGEKSILKLLMPMLLAAAVGALDEIHQLWIPRRSCSAGDWIADTVAVIAGAALFVWGVRRSRGWVSALILGHKHEHEHEE